MFLDDAKAYRQSQPGAFTHFFGCEKRIHDLALIFFGYARAVVTYFYKHILICVFCCDRNMPRPINNTQGLNCIDNNIDQKRKVM